MDSPYPSPDQCYCVRFDFVGVVIGSELQLKCPVNFVRIPSVPPHIDYFGLCFCISFRQGYRGASGNVPQREGKEEKECQEEADYSA